MTHKVREAERERQFEEFKDRVGEIVNGSVKRVEYGNTIVDLGRGEGIMRRDQSIPRENFNLGDRIRCYIYDVRRETKGPQIMLSRAHGGCFGVLFNLVVAIDKRDAYTKFHSEHVASWAVRLAQILGLDAEVLLILKLAGLLHDVGKIGVPDFVLRKPGALTAEEYDIMKGHVTLSERLIQEIPYQEQVLAAVSCHHERWDGQGYPHGRAGKEMPLTGRILGIVDAFSAMSLDRPYRTALSLEVICERLMAGSGTQFDPQLVLPFVTELRKVGDPKMVIDLAVDRSLNRDKNAEDVDDLRKAA